MFLIGEIIKLNVGGWFTKQVQLYKHTACDLLACGSDWIVGVCGRTADSNSPQ